MPTIHLNNLTKTYPGSDTPAVNNINLTVKDGEFMCLLGPSGCGKTTILRMIAGIEHASGGEIRIGDKLVDSIAHGTYVPPEKRGIGLVFQSYALWPHMTVEQNVDFGLRLQKAPTHERIARCQDVMEKLRIADYAKRYPAQLSGGQQQRVALARMLAVNPGVLLLDEPLSNLDATLRLEMRAELRRLHETFGTTIVFVSHDQWEAMTLATTIAVMSAGHMQQVGTPDEIYATPANRFVAEFIGTPRLNMIPLNQPVSLLASHLQQRFNLLDRTLHCGIRPEEIVLSEGAGNNGITMTIDNIMPTGGSWVIELVAGEDRLFHSTQLRPRWQPRQQVHCQLPTHSLHFFNSSGLRHDIYAR
ncbi:ATP-binding cassette domain-containing protein [Raoultella sp. Lac2]|jgi:iron(III) transport system ATP-binding protein|uniref:ABC transporter ATP-binding protein n=1 Tax=Klebsiella electrica TaxID=1259973 RepID=A0AAJ5UCI7_9ENTR|nr:ABC transporter ATP-binding protein [Klebsiella electrica]MXF47642.1 ATP-binding cassette domain-containing protein [Raoultella sp. Lac2]MXF98103.1 ATP-binding cassette domain-containing protein [Raoultella sp. Lac1]BBV76873.1 ABC transporter ATP-binding protein [Raoultella planticola]QDI09058.1 Maltose/maltodextrin import ATP-binding protein MalK [Klebsiella electrica]WBW59374.1 ABC transporter ATP-binding protein [Klebsiella electrica]